MNIRQIAKGAMVGAVLCGSLCRMVQAAYLENQSDSPAIREFVPPGRIPDPMPESREGNPLRRLLQRVEIGRPQHSGGLSVFPILLRDSGDLGGVRTLDEALSRGWITIREQEQARVSEVVVRNESRHPVFMMAGEMLGGGRQDRIIRNDVLVRANGETVTVPVYCGEQNRWKGDRESFDSAPYLAGQAMRSMAARGESQEAIWGEIDHRLKSAGVSAPTRSYQSLYGDRDTRRHIDAVVDCFHGVRTRRTVGLVILFSGQVVSGDLFGDPDLCERLWDKIIRSHAADGELREPGRRVKETMIDGSSTVVRRFLEELSWTGQRRESTPGAGECFVLSGRVDGHVLVWNDGLVHASAFPVKEWYSRPPMTGPWPVPMR